MSRWRPSAAVRLKVAERAEFKCEYCKMHEDDLFLSFELDHLIAVKHGGGNEMENLGYSCPHCNQHKGTDLTTFVDFYQNIVVLFNPRFHVWEEHFSVDNGAIISETEIGKATIKLLKMNNPELIEIRALFQALGRYP